MSRNIYLIILLVLTLGFAATMISVFYRQDLSHGFGTSITGYGFPLSWCKETTIIYPRSPTELSFSLEYFALDVVFWSLMLAVPVVAMLKRSGRL